MEDIQGKVVDNIQVDHRVVEVVDIEVEPLLGIHNIHRDLQIASFRSSIFHYIREIDPQELKPFS